jgi:RND family efflux transporter MFP subunit
VTEELLDEKKAELAVASSKLAACRADILVKESRVRVAKDDLDRARILASFAQIRAPFDGVISYRSVDEGDFVQNASTGQPRPLMTLAATDKVKLVLHVPEREAIWAEIGGEASVQVDARVNWLGKGQVSRVGPTLDVQTRTRQVEIDLENKDRKLIPGMYGQVTLALQRIERAPAIPATAVYSRHGENFVLQVVGGVVQRQRVRIQFDDGKELVVVKLVGDKELPLDGTEELVVSNKGEIAEGQAVKATRLSTQSSQLATAKR